MRPNGRVIDAGCGSGLLGLLALREGASQVVGVDRDNVALAAALATENGAQSRLQFFEMDLQDFALAPGDQRFDCIIAFVYTNHIIIDEARSALVARLRDSVGAPDCTTVPNRVRYSAVACDWPSSDISTEYAGLRRAVAELECRYNLRLGPIGEAVAAELQFAGARPSLKGDYDWMPGGGNGGYRYPRGAFRFLSEPAPVADILYDREHESKWYPRSVPLSATSTGTITSILWIQEFMYDDFLIWTTESRSPARRPMTVEHGQIVRLVLDEEWRAANRILVEAGA